MTTELEQTLERMRALVEFIDDYPLTPEVRERMTYRDMREVIAAKRRELGLDHASLNQDDLAYDYEISHSLREALELPDAER